MVFVRKEKDFSPKFTLLSLAEIPVDQLVAISHLCTYWLKQNVSSKIPSHKQNIAWYAVFKPPYLPVHEIIFCYNTEAFTGNFQFMCGAKFSAFG